jgi:hypothetical protein
MGIALRLCAAALVAGAMTGISCKAVSGDMTSGRASPESPAICTLPAGYAPGAPVLVSIAVTPPSGAGIYAVEDAPPGAWAVGKIDNNGAWDNHGKKVKFGPFFDGNARTLTYQAIPPPGEFGGRIFAGTASFDGDDFLIMGDRRIKPLPPPLTSK